MRDISISKIGVSHLSKMISCLQISPVQTYSDRRWKMSVSPKLQFSCPIPNHCVTISYLTKMRWRWVSPLSVLVMTILSLSTVTMCCAQNPNTPSAHTICNSCVAISYFKKMRWRWVSPLFVLMMTILSLYSRHEEVYTKSQHSIFTHNLKSLCPNLLL